MEETVNRKSCVGQPLLSGSNRSGKSGRVRPAVGSPTPRSPRSIVSQRRTSASNTRPAKMNPIADQIRRMWPLGRFRGTGRGAPVPSEYARVRGHPRGTTAGAAAG